MRGTALRGPPRGLFSCYPCFVKEKQEAEVVAWQLHPQTEDTFAPQDIQRVDKGATEMRG